MADTFKKQVEFILGFTNSDHISKISLQRFIIQIIHRMFLKIHEIQKLRKFNLNLTLGRSFSHLCLTRNTINNRSEEKCVGPRKPNRQHGSE